MDGDFLFPSRQPFAYPFNGALFNAFGSQFFDESSARDFIEHLSKVQLKDIYCRVLVH
jgi:hypothetical protein